MTSPTSFYFRLGDTDIQYKSITFVVEVNIGPASDENEGLHKKKKKTFSQGLHLSTASRFSSKFSLS